MLTIEGQYFLPAYDDVTMFYLKEVLAGRKKLYKMHQIKAVNVPRLREFSADKLYRVVIQDPNVSIYLPDCNEK